MYEAPVPSPAISCLYPFYVFFIWGGVFWREPEQQNPKPHLLNLFRGRPAQQVDAESFSIGLKYIFLRS